MSRILHMMSAVALVGVLGCGEDKRAPDPVVALPKKPRVVFLTDMGEVPVHVDVARTSTQKEQGLMWVEHLEPGRGMVFLMGPPQRVLTFWMKNTYIPLDMIFLDAKKQVVGVVAQAEPLTLSARRVDVPSSYVVEVPGGWAAKNAIAAGVKARFENVE